MAKILPTDHHQRPRPELFPDPETKVNLTKAAERLLMEGLEGGAKLAFQDAIDALYDQYANVADLLCYGTGVNLRISFQRPLKIRLSFLAPWRHINVKHIIASILSQGVYFSGAFIDYK